MATAEDYQRIGNSARIYNAQQNIDRTQCTRTVPMQVLCLGYSRTGTLSMHKAMEILGYPNPYHFSSCVDNVQECDLWVAALQAKYDGIGELPAKKFFDGMLGHCGACMDAPCILFAEELIKYYPDAKVVLVERDMDSWYQSWVNFCQSAYNPVLSALAKLDPLWLGRITALGEFATQTESGFAKTPAEAAVRCKAAYRHHYRDVREMVPKERLLEFKLAEGWEPLCRFLGKDVPGPDVPFPHENETAMVRQAFAEMMQIAIKNIANNAADPDFAKKFGDKLV